MMAKTEVYLCEEEHEALRRIADETGRSVAELIREAIRHTWLEPPGDGPVRLWDGPVARSSVEHDHIYDDR